MASWQTGLDEIGWNSLFWGNHDYPRAISRFGNDTPEYREQSGKMLATLLYGMKGTPYLYQGDEIGMTNVVNTKISQYQDIESANFAKEKQELGWSEEKIMSYLLRNSRDNARTPMQWNHQEHAGFTTGTPWLSVNGNYKEINVENSRKNPDSLFYYYKTLIALRKNNDVLIYGKFQLLDKEHPEIFAYGCSFYKIVLLFFIGAFLGDITETIFCRITADVWMSRSSVVWGDFSIVWGLAIAAVTALLYRYRNRSEQFLFWMGTFLGGAYEYICSVFTEIVFGTVFWDYSDIPFNLGGRINLLYCFFWGFAAVVWFKILYPRVSRLIEKFPVKPGKIITWLLLIFMLADGIVSSAALARYNARSNGIEATNSFESWVDEHFDDARMAKVYPKAKKVD